MRTRAPLLLLLLLAAIAARGMVFLDTVSPLDGAETFHNPGCGPAEGEWIVLSPGMPTSGADLCRTDANCTALWRMEKYSKGYLFTTNGVPLLDHYAHITNNFVGGADIPLDGNALLSISNSLLACRRNGGTCIPRFRYTDDEWAGAEPDDFSTILTHIRQLAGVVSQFRDVVPAIECGIIGVWGEMHKSRYAKNGFQNQVVGAWLEGLPANMPVLVRYPGVWTLYLGTTPSAFMNGGLEAMDEALRARMGLFNDGYLGNDNDYGTWNNGDHRFTRDEGRRFLSGQTVPYGGELATITEEYFDKNVHLLDPARHNIVKEWYDTHLSYLRNIGHSRYTIYRRLANTAFQSATWAFSGMPNLSEYDGLDLRKFCEDHMGYRYVVRGVHATNDVGPKSQVLSPKSGRGVMALDLEIENTGFGQLLFDEVPEVLLIPSAIPSSSTDGESAISCATTASATFASIRGGETAHVTLTCPMPTVPGAYDVYLRLRVPLADETGTSTPRRVVRFANANGYNATLKANYLCTVSLDDLVDIVPDDMWFAYRDATGRSFGGSWSEGRTADGFFRKRTFSIDNPLPSDKTGQVEIDLAVEISNEILEAGRGVAGFIFLSEDGGDIPQPYGYTAEGWTRLQGRSFTEGEEITLRVLLDANFIAYGVGDTVLRDALGRRFLPAGGRTRATSTLSVIGGGDTADLTGRLSSDSRIPTALLMR